jgi:hypothetical protein
MFYFRQSTASQILPIGPLVSTTDGVTPYTTALANTEIKVQKAGGTTLTSKNSGGSTHISNGCHYATMDATDTNTLGSTVIYIIATGVVIQRIPCVVLQANVYDAMVAGTVYLETNPGKFSISGSDLSLKNRAGTQDSTRTITSATADPITGLA